MKRAATYSDEIDIFHDVTRYHMHGQRRLVRDFQCTPMYDTVELVATSDIEIWAACLFINDMDGNKRAPFLPRLGRTFEFGADFFYSSVS
jgi:hypothetical protein